MHARSFWLKLKNPLALPVVAWHMAGLPQPALESSGKGARAAQGEGSGAGRGSSSHLVERTGVPGSLLAFCHRS